MVVRKELRMREAPTVLSDTIPAPHPALDDGTTIKTVLVRAYETRNFPTVHTVREDDVSRMNPFLLHLFFFFAFSFFSFLFLVG